HLLISDENRHEYEEPAAHPANELEHAAIDRIHDRPVVAAISNPRTVHSLIELAAAASPAEGQPLRVLTLVRTPAGGVRSGLREIEERVTPRAPLLVSAIDRAQMLGVQIQTQAAWSDDPGRDLVEMTESVGAGWLMIGVHQAVFGTNEMGGTVSDVM